ncbi:MAG TPA: hypothetical protein VFH27_09950, partial [Longimicrobiaceae bacterium]|nr:hypothetical protein [Longimicrobiaceae bacterium]
MPQDHAARFVATLARAVLRDGEREALAREAREALDAVFAAQKSLVLDVQFTGFTAKGHPVGGISPELLRGAGQLIMMRVSRVGFTPEARAEDLDALFEIAARGPGELGQGGIIAAVREAAPQGIYVSTSGGETYRPAPAPRPAPAEQPAPVAESPAVAEAPQPAPAPIPDTAPVVAAVAEEPRAEAAASSAGAATESPALDSVDGVESSADSGSHGGVVVDSAADGEAGASTVGDATAEESADGGVVEPVPASATDEGRPVDAEEPRAEATPAAVEPADAEPEAAVEPAAPPPAPAPAAPAAPNVLGFDLEGDGMAFTDFEVLEAFPEAGEVPAGPAAAPPPPSGSGDDGSGGSLYNFFRSSHGQVDAEAAELPKLLHRADSLNQFDDLAQGCARTAARLVSIDQHGEALDVLEALIREAERPDRSRVFRESAVQSLRRAGTEQTLHSFLGHLQRHVEERDRVVRLFLFLGGDSVALLDGLLFRTGDPDLRAALFKRLAGQEGGSARLLARTMADPTPGRTRAMLELAAPVGLEAETALRWIGEAATHPDSTVRMDAARHASGMGGR